MKRKFIIFLILCCMLNILGVYGGSKDVVSSPGVVLQVVQGYLSNIISLHFDLGYLRNLVDILGIFSSLPKNKSSEPVPSETKKQDIFCFSISEIKFTIFSNFSSQEENKLSFLTLNEMCITKDSVLRYSFLLTIWYLSWLFYLYLLKFYFLCPRSSIDDSIIFFMGRNDNKNPN